MKAKVNDIIQSAIHRLINPPMIAVDPARLNLEPLRRPGMENLGTVTTAQESSNTLTVEMIERARDVLARNNVPVYREMTATEVLHRQRELRGEIYGRSPVAMWIDEFADVTRRMYEEAAMFGIGGMVIRDEEKRAKPEPEEKYSCNGAPEKIVSACGRFTAELLNSNIRLWQESEDMRNCIFRSYSSGIKLGRYIAYHVSAPHLGFKHGFTVGFEAQVIESARCEDKCQTKVKQKYICEQIKGKANSKNDDADLKAFGDYIAQVLGVHSVTLNDEDFKTGGGVLGAFHGIRFIDRGNAVRITD